MVSDECGADCLEEHSSSDIDWAGYTVTQFVTVEDWEFTGQDRTFVVHRLDTELFEAENVFESRLRKVGYFWGVLPEVVGKSFVVITEFEYDSRFWELISQPGKTLALNPDFTFEIAFLRVAVESGDCVEVAVVPVYDKRIWLARFAEFDCFQNCPFIVVGQVHVAENGDFF